MVTIYSTPTCAPCRVAEVRLRDAGIPFQKIDLTQEPGILAELKERLDVPMVNTPTFGFRDELHVGLQTLSAIIETALTDGES